MQKTDLISDRGLVIGTSYSVCGTCIQFGIGHEKFLTGTSTFRMSVVRHLESNSHTRVEGAIPLKKAVWNRSESTWWTVRC